MDVLDKFLNLYSYKFPKGYPDINDPNFGHVWVKLMSLSNGHIKAILDTQKQIEVWTRELFEAELAWRDFHHIYIEEVESYE